MVSDANLHEDARAALAEPLARFLRGMHDVPLAEAQAWGAPPDLVGYLDTARFELDLRDPATATTVTDQQTICTSNDARGTPTFFINGRMLSGAQPYDKFKEVIDQELAGGI